MRALVTGVAGFIGSHLAASLLRDGHEVTGVDCYTDYYARDLKERNLQPLLRTRAFRFVASPLQGLDLPPLMRECEAIFHMAAQPGVRASWGREFEIYTTHNVLVTQKMLEAAVGAEIRRFVYASSSSVYGDTPKLPSSEEDPVCPLSPYGVTKLAAENLARLYHANYGVPTVSLRYFTVYGPRQRPDMAFHRFMRAAVRGEELLVYGDGLQTRDFTYVDDVVAATRAAGELGVAGGVYNIGGGHRVSLNEVIESICATAGRPVTVKRLGKERGDVKHTWADTTRARADLKFAPATDLRDGLQEELKWIRLVYA
ncbi:MAG: NAD-dependent epimerase/dehydratase family protein [Acidobacteriota bacterium]